MTFPSFSKSFTAFDPQALRRQLLQGMEMVSTLLSNSPAEGLILQ